MSEEEIQEAVDLLARHAALLERVTVLERALEEAGRTSRSAAVGRLRVDDALVHIGALTRKALDG